ncbi:unnamed protein product [Lymnaea stagnalis]|uniref:BAH domain-containing protein n=1 Tax=Lymnaea stagnalis TaxID=6523 RepID=A0AAV2HKN9_LYMST
MKNKPVVPGNSGRSNAKGMSKESGKQGKMMSPKKAETKRAPLKLRTKTDKSIANRTRDKSPKETKTLSARKSQLPLTDKSKVTKSRLSDSTKSKTLSQKKSNDLLRGVKSKVSAQKTKADKAKASLKQKDIKRKLKKLTSSNSFLDFWGLKVVGKREASLNASLKVNIMYERSVPVKSQVKVPKKLLENSEEGPKEEKGKDKASIKVTPEEAVDKNRLVKKECSRSKTKLEESSKSQKSSLKNSQTKPKKESVTMIHTGSDKKRRSPEYKIFKDEPPAKCRKTSSAKSLSKAKAAVKKKKKPFPSGHQLSNIIEKSPRQASLIAKAMIALEQEEESVLESAARTRVFDWTELRSYVQNPSRQMRWKTGLGSPDPKPDVKSSDAVPATDKDETSEIDVSNLVDSVEERESFHNTLLRTLHQVGDSRLLKEYLRAQKEDFHGCIDVEKCPTPEKLKVASPSPKKLCLTPVSDEKPEKIASPVKIQSCRVATPIPQLPVGQRTSHMTSYIHHPIPQPVYAPQHSHPQPIKVPPSYTQPAYIYQYAMDRQQGLYVPSSPSPVPYGVSSSDIVNDFSSYTLGPMGTRSLGRRGIAPYQANFNPSIHLPMQQIAGFNYPSYYTAPIQSLPQSNGPALQALHQRYPLVQAQSVIHALPQDMGQMGTYPAGYQPYPQLPNMSQDAGCMPPPPPPAHSHRPTSIGPPPLGPPSISHQPSVSPMESLRSMNPVGVQPIVKSPVLDFTTGSDRQAMNPHRQMVLPAYNKTIYYSTNRNTNSNSPAKYSVSINGHSTFSPCKKEREEVSAQNCDVIQRSTICSSESTQRTSNPRRTSSEGSDVSDLLHSAHTAMYQIDGMNSSEIHQTQSSVMCNTTVGKSSPSKISIIGHTSFNASYSVSSILDMPTYKIKPEPPEVKLCAMHPANLPNSINCKPLDVPQKENTPCTPCVMAASTISDKGTDTRDLKMETPSIKTQKLDSVFLNQSSCQVVLEKPLEAQRNNNDVIVIDDTDESSDDEPLAKLVKAKTNDNAENVAVEPSLSDSQKVTDALGKKNQSQISGCLQLKNKVKKEVENKIKEDGKLKSGFKKTEKQSIVSISYQRGPHNKEKKCVSFKTASDAEKRAIMKVHENNNNTMTPLIIVIDDATKVDKSGEFKARGNGKKTLGVSNPKSKKLSKKVKVDLVFPQVPPRANTNHGWTWVGEGQMKAIPKLTLAREEHVRIRKSFKAMRHSSGEVVSVRDSVILQSDGDGSIPYVARVSALWENLNGEMMFSMLWYYQPEHTVQGREPEDGEQELFASKHREENSVACIDDKCFVLMYNEYCRLEAEAVRIEQGVALPRWRAQLPGISEEDQKFLRPKPPANACAENIWFCRYDYDIRKKIVKKPKHKKSNLRYRAPCKIV